MQHCVAIPLRHANPQYILMYPLSPCFRDEGLFCLCWSLIPGLYKPEIPSKLISSIDCPSCHAKASSSCPCSQPPARPLGGDLRYPLRNPPHSSCFQGISTTYPTLQPIHDFIQSMYKGRLTVEYNAPSVVLEVEYPESVSR